MIFLKSMKAVSIAIALLPLAGCAISTGLIFAALINSCAINPDSEDSLFSMAMLGFALVETFMIITLGIVVVVISL